jgi:ketol-acid reductoisomerase
MALLLFRQQEGVMTRGTEAGTEGDSRRRRVGVIDCGREGRAHALHLDEGGVQVTVGTAAEVAAWAEVIVLLVPERTASLEAVVDLMLPAALSGEAAHDLVEHGYGYGV